MNPQDEFLDAQIRRAIALERAKNGVGAAIGVILASGDRELRALLNARLENIRGRGAPGTPKPNARFEGMIVAATNIRLRMFEVVAATLRPELFDLVHDEIRFQNRTFDRHIPVALELTIPATEQAFAAATERPMLGRDLKEWFSEMAASDVQRIKAQLRIGYVDGLTNDEIVRSVSGSAANRARDGTTIITRRHVETIVRTSMQHYANTARDAVWSQNADILDGLRWVSVLDGRTSAICRARDGKLYPVDGGPRPPAHPNCRSVMVAHFDGESLAELGRPYVKDTRTRRKREVDFGKQARQEAGAAWRGRMRELRRKWGDENIGQVAGDVTYDQFLRRQSVRFQNEVLGKTKGILYRKGGLTMSRFVNERTGHEYTIKELKIREPEAWDVAFQ
jgi:SPP1 gp7 family putative phage head morphogenesis protein